MKCYYSYCDKDIKIINDFLNEKGIYFDSPKMINILYEEFCDKKYYANWMTVDYCILIEFYDYLKEKIENRDDERFEFL